MREPQRTPCAAHHSSDCTACACALQALYDFYVRATRGFAYFYYTECALKLLGLGVGGYLRDGWNRLDLLLVVLSLLDQVRNQLMKHAIS